jgi:hypothetical protein
MHHFGQIRTRGTNRWGGELWGLLRLGTDMDSTWLPNEERTCQTHPDEKGRVAIVACSTSGSRPYHNIPVKFWGGVDRNSVSDWKRRREGDQFVCRAIGQRNYRGATFRYAANSSAPTSLQWAMR